jgi:carbonic anhydrase
MENLVQGFRRFRATAYNENRDTFDYLAKEGQSPRALVVSCCDSRVDPQMIFTAMPGEIFVIRNVANLVPPYQPTADYHGTSAALEFGVRHLKVEHIIVLGHSGCGGIRALLRGPSGGVTDFIGPWMQIAAPARDRVTCDCGDDEPAALRELELESIKISLANLMTFPWIRDPVREGRLQLHGCLFDLERGDLLCLDRETDTFVACPVDEPPTAAPAT